jgi:hypothetical protein
VEAQNDATLAELRAQLAEKTDLWVSVQPLIEPSKSST